MLRRTAADEVKRQQELKEKERQRIILERTGEPKPIADLSEGSEKEKLNKKKFTNPFEIITLFQINYMKSAKNTTTESTNSTRTSGIWNWQLVSRSMRFVGILLFRFPNGNSNPTSIVRGSFFSLFCCRSTIFNQEWMICVENCKILNNWKNDNHFLTKTISA